MILQYTIDARVGERNGKGGGKKEGRGLQSEIERDRDTTVYPGKPQSTARHPCYARPARAK